MMSSEIFNERFSKMFREQLSTTVDRMLSNIAYLNHLVSDGSRSDVEVVRTFMETASIGIDELTDRLKSYTTTTIKTDPSFTISMSIRFLLVEIYNIARKGKNLFCFMNSTTINSILASVLKFSVKLQSITFSSDVEWIEFNGINQTSDRCEASPLSIGDELLSVNTKDKNMDDDQVEVEYQGKDMDKDNENTETCSVPDVIFVNSHDSSPDVSFYTLPIDCNANVQSTPGNGVVMSVDDKMPSPDTGKHVEGLYQSLSTENSAKCQSYHVNVTTPSISTASTASTAVLSISDSSTSVIDSAPYREQVVNGITFTFPDDVTLSDMEWCPWAVSFGPQSRKFYYSILDPKKILKSSCPPSLRFSQLRYINHNVDAVLENGVLPHVRDNWSKRWVIWEDTHRNEATFTSTLNYFNVIVGMPHILISHKWKKIGLRLIFNVVVRMGGFRACFEHAKWEDARSEILVIRAQSRSPIAESWPLLEEIISIDKDTYLCAQDLAYVYMQHLAVYELVIVRQEWSKRHAQEVAQRHGSNLCGFLLGELSHGDS